MKVYIAAPWIHRDAAEVLSVRLLEEGHELTERWWEHPPVDDSTPEGAAELARQGRRDIEGVRNADAMLLLNTAKSEGKAVEQGIAIERGIPIVAIGGRQSHNVFQFLSNYHWADSTADALVKLRQLAG